MIVVSIAAFGLVGVLGVAADMGRVFIAKNETQTYCDAGALAAALALDGTASGITKATTAAAAAGNGWNLGMATLPAPTVEFATAAAGPWSTSAAAAILSSYVRVTANVDVTTYFATIFSQSTTQRVRSIGVAAQIPLSNLTQGLGPYTAVASDLSSPTFGLVVGSQYDIQWPQYNATRSGCNASNPDRCFNQDTCTGEQTNARRQAIWQMTQTWGSSTNGYWGGTSNSEITAEVLNLVQLQAVAVGGSLTMTNGNKQAQAGVLDTRVGQDNDMTSGTASAYLASSTHNGRRLFSIPIVSPTGPGTSTVNGYGLFLLNSNGMSSNYYQQGNGNDGFCAIFAGSYVIGSIGPGVGASGGYKVQLVQ